MQGLLWTRTKETCHAGPTVDKNKVPHFWRFITPPKPNYPPPPKKKIPESVTQRRYRPTDVDYRK